MSCYLVSKTDIDTLITAAFVAEMRPIYGKEDSLGRDLWRENLASVNARYKGAETGNEIEAYHFTRVFPQPSIVVLLKAIAHYGYQSCEHKAWKDGASARFCDALRNALITMLPGYSLAPWGEP